MRATRGTIEAAAGDGAEFGFVIAIERAIAARLPIAAPYIPLLSRVARFLSVGVVGLAVDAGVFGLLYSHGGSAPLSRAASLVLATVVTWYLNRLCTFGASGRAPLAEMSRYFGVALIAQGFNYVAFLSLHYALSETRPFACLLVAAALTAIFSFTGQSAFAFARAQAPAPRMDA